MSKEIERGAETKVDSERLSVRGMRSYERVRAIVAKEMQMVLKMAAREMRAYSKEGGDTGKIFNAACEACLGALSAADCVIIGTSSFEPSRMRRFMNDSTGMYHKYHQLEHQYGSEEALKRLYEQEVAKNTGAYIRYMNSNRKTASGKWVWRVNRADSSGVIFILTYETGSSSFKWVDNIRIVKELERKALSEVAMIAKEGVPINIATLQVEDPEFEIVDNKLEVFARVNVRWISGQDGWKIFDVEEAIMEAGLDLV